jgi:hypothetical protein
MPDRGAYRRTQRCLIGPVLRLLWYEHCIMKKRGVNIGGYGKLHRLILPEGRAPPPSTLRSIAACLARHL